MLFLLTTELLPEAGGGGIRQPSLLMLYMRHLTHPPKALSLKQLKPHPEADFFVACSLLEFHPSSYQQ